MNLPRSGEPAPLLSRGLEGLGLAVPAAQQQRLLAFVALLDKWNRVFNLTAVRDPAQMVVRHLLDSLVVLPYIKGPRVLDVGSGAGLPGIPLAIVTPQWRFILLDKQRKKVRFMTQAVIELGLDNVELVQAAVEDYVPAAPMDTVIARAFAPLDRVLQCCGHLCGVGGRLLAMKGRHSPAELQALPGGFRLTDHIDLHVPGLDAHRHLAVFAPA